MRRLFPNLVLAVSAAYGWSGLCAGVAWGADPGAASEAALNEVLASPSQYRDVQLSLEGLVADPRLARAPEGRTCSFALVSPNSNMGLAVLGATPPEIGAYVRVEGPLRLDPRLNTPYIESPQVTVLRELPMWLRPTDHQSLAALGSVLCAAMACLLLSHIVRARRRSSPRRLSSLAAAAVLPKVDRASSFEPTAAVEPSTSEAPESAPTVVVPTHAEARLARGDAEVESEAVLQCTETASSPEEDMPAIVSAMGVQPPDDEKAARPAVGELIVEVLSGPDRGQVFRVSGTEITIGRSEGRDVHLTDETVTSHQATLIRLNGSVELHSEVGGPVVVSLNSRPVRQAFVLRDDIIRLGASELRVTWPTDDVGELAQVARR